PVRIRARGNQVLSTPMINRGTAFTLEEREALGLTGLLPGGVSTIDGQLRRVYAQYLRQPDDLAKNVYLSHLRDRNEVLYYRLLTERIQEMLPIVYTPTIGKAIERYSHEYRRPPGVYPSRDPPQDVETAFRNYGLGADDVDLIVATDAEGILGIGDQGVGGIEIPIGKLAVYTAAAGIHPRRVIPVVLDMGTDNLGLLNDEMYLGNRHARVRDQRYDELIDTYVQTATKLFPHALLHWEDFGASNARRILERYADHCCTFNDDMQGTAAVVLAAAFSAVRAAGGRMRDQRVVIHGGGTAGLGIADMLREVMVREGLSPEEAGRRFYALGRGGLLTDDQTATMYDFQVPYARPASEVAGWSRRRGRAGRRVYALGLWGLLTDDQTATMYDFQVPYARPASEVAGWSRSAGGDGAGLADVVANVRPTMLIGTSTQSGAFSEAIVREMAAHVERPIIMPLSNPTSKAEALPEDLIRWTDAKALVATGSPFPPVEHNGRTYRIAQANNALVFPG